MPDPPHSGGDHNSPAQDGVKKLAARGGGSGGEVVGPPVMEVRFDGGDIWPNKIPVPDLALVIRAIQRLASGRSPDDSTSADRENLRLVGVRRGSARYSLTGLPPAVVRNHLRVLGDVIERPEQIGESDYLLGPVGVLSHAATKLGCQISIREPSRGGAVLARIGPDTYGNLAKSVLIAGQTEFGGRVERVGGASRSRCGLRVGFQKRMLICRVPNPADARTLGENLYKRVVISGEATWIKSTWRVFSFRVEAVRPLKDGSLSEKIRAIRDAGGSDWDRVSDVRGYLDLGGEQGL